MADAIVSAVAQRLTAIIEEEILNQVDLVTSVEKEVLKLANELNTIRNVLDDAEKRGIKDKSVKDWLTRLEDASHDMDDVLDEWSFAFIKIQKQQSRVKVCSSSSSSSCLCFKKFAVRRDIAKKIKKLKAQLDQILEEKDRYNFHVSTIDPSPPPRRVQTTALIDLVTVYGRERDKGILVNKLIMCSGVSRNDLGIQIVSVVGVGGLGKTTLAQLVYNDSRVKDCFESRIWICVSDPFDEVMIAKGIIECVGGGSSFATNQLNILFKHLIEAVSGKKFFLVLDDVWTEDYSKWESLKNCLQCGGEGSVILVTTRNERVAKMMGAMDNDILNLDQLCDEDCWLLLRRIALSGRSGEECRKLDQIGKKISDKCKGLPLAAKTLGSLLRFKNTWKEWQNVLDSEIWEMKEVEIDLFPHLLLSYNELSPTLKRCFSYCSVFPKDSVIDVEDLIKNWIALGYVGPDIGNSGDMELRGRECFDILAMRSLFQDFKKDTYDEQIESCKMHDIVHDFARFLRMNGRVEVARTQKTICQVCNPLLVTSVKTYRSLFWHKKSPPSLCDCLTSVRVLKLTSCNLPCLPKGIENLIHLRWLDLSGSKLLSQDTKTICKLYNLQFLWLTSCDLEHIPWEIGNLVQLRHLDLRGNIFLRELPESLCSLHELQTLNVDNCFSLSALPKGIHRLINLKHLHFENTPCIHHFPRGLDRLTALTTLTGFHETSGRSKLGWLKNLNHLTGFLKLWIKLTNDLDHMVVEDACEAELRKKIHIQSLDLIFEDKMDEKELALRMDVMDALEPHLDLRKLKLWFYGGSKLPSWIHSPLNQLKCVKLLNFKHLSSLPPLGKLPCLEEAEVSGMSALTFVGREFLGLSTTIRTATHVANVVSFPKMKKLMFNDCPKWEEWEDIRAENEEEEFADVSIMPCLRELAIVNCPVLMELPRGLLCKALGLEVLDISDSTHLQRYRDKDGSAWKSLCQNQHIRIEF